MVPATFADFAQLHDAFDACFVSQKDAEFPSPDYNGPFSHVAQRVQVEQRQALGTLLGDNTLNNSGPGYVISRFHYEKI